jgi:iron complex outermembrane receptor protein
MAAEEPDPLDGDDGFVTVVVAGSVDRGPSISEISREDALRDGAASVADSMARDPSISVATDSRGERVMSIRGFDPRQTALLVDGIPAWLPWDGTLDLGMVPAEIIDRITVVKGPASILWGPNGLGGAVNVVTRRPGSGPLAEARFEGTIPGDVRLSGAHSFRVGPVAWTVFGGADRRDAWPLSRRFKSTPTQDSGLRVNSDSSRVHAGGKVRAEVSTGHDIEASLTFLDGSRGVPPSTIDPQPRFWRFDDWRAIMASVAHEGSWTGRLRIDEAVYIRRFTNTLNAFDDDSFLTRDGPDAFRSSYEDWIAGGRVRGRLAIDPTPWGPTVLRLWASAQHERHSQTSDTGPPQADVDRTILTVAPEVQADLPGRWRLVLGAQVDVEVPGEFPGGRADTAVGWGPMLSIEVEPLETLVLKATAARRNRFPTLRERFATGGDLFVANPGLGPETTWHFGVEGAWEPVRGLVFQAAVYDAEVRGLIQRETVSTSGERLVNVGAARLLGAEASLGYRLDDRLDALIGYAWMHARRTDSGAPDNRLEYRPSHRASVSVAGRPARWIELSTRVDLTGPVDFRHPVTRAWGRLGTRVGWDARIEIRPAKGPAVWLRGENLLDANVQGRYGYPEPGRRIWLGLSVSMGGR